MMKIFVLLVLLVAAAQADVYLHQPRGSNNRLDEANRGRNNGNRLFDSQNNNRGGYNVGGIYYYEGTQVHFEWTNQHSCNDENNDCELIIQYTCDSMMRDGSTTQTIPENPVQCRDFDCQTDLKYGMHENFDYYQNCKYRSRNMGLFIADRNLNRKDARYTRQNDNGNRRGYECPEERDYYPYWGPTQWKDVVIMTSDVSRCPYYQDNSQNVKPRFACQVPDPYFQYKKRCGTGRTGYIIPITEAECKKVSWNYERDATNPTCAKEITAYDPTHPETGVNSSLIIYGQWLEYPSHGIAGPDCQEAPWSRDNHLGNGIGGFPNSYNWTVPNLDHEFCVFRIRYNISTSEFDGWSKTNWTTMNAVNPRPGKPTNIPIWDQVKLNETTARSRGYVFRQNPVVHMFGETTNMPLRLAINTNQFSRTFQDRTHAFAVRPRPAELKEAVIHNVQVRGKRGNIVQTYPGVEYDFAPNRLEMASDEYIHFQWTGSNTNPNNNAGQGKQGTDRHNVVMLEEPRYEEGSMPRTSLYGQWGLNYPQHLDNTTFLGFNRTDMDTLAFLTSHQFRGEMSELDDAGTYFDMKPRKVTDLGTYHYMCTRNNNFSNRSQKGKITVGLAALAYKMIGWNGGAIELTGGANRLTVPRGTFTQPQSLRVEHWKEKDCQQLLENLGSGIYGTGETASDCLAVFPERQLAYGNNSMWMNMKLNERQSGGKVRVYQTTTGAANSWTEVTINSSDATSVAFQAKSGGIYVVKKEPNVALIVSITAACIVVGLIILGTIFYFKRYPGKFSKMRTNTSQSLQYAVRSFQTKV
ncbi:protein DD3-3-like [Sycon ciliatum]|uniref:protein DD3-3-like n=1 Tax=Sycon ciliatum TaxID=27933 RepID=UPI0031F6D9B3